MLQIFDNSPGVSRRNFLTVGSLAGLSLPAFLAAKARGVETQRSVTTGKSVIFVMQHGGPSQLETWDPKMDAPASTRTATGQIQTSAPGMYFGGKFQELATRAHKVAVVRNFQTESGNHDIKPIVSPHSLGANIGSLYSRVVGPLRSSGMPTNIAVCPNSVDAKEPPFRNRFGDILSGGALGTSYVPFVPGAGGSMQQSMRLNLDRSRIDDRRALLTQIDGLRREIDVNNTISAVDRYHEQALDVILGGVASSFDLSREDPRLISKYDTAFFDRPNSWSHRNNKLLYGQHARSLGKLLLLARRLCEAGCGFVTVHTEFVWDMHADGNNLSVTEGMELVGRPFDHAVSAFIDDCEARGLGDDIMLVATGEMGRTPRLNGNGGRDHWGKLTPLMVYGGGIGRGQIIGQSTRDGGEPASSPQTSRNLIGTIMNTLFNIGEVRLMSGIPADVMRVITEYKPIAGL